MNAIIGADSETTAKFISYVMQKGVDNCDIEELKQLEINVSSNEHLNTSYFLAHQLNKEDKKEQVKNIYLYAARDTTTGKLVSNITSPRRKYWDREANARAAINSYNNRSNYYGRRANHGKVELVKFELVEVPVDGD